MLKYIAIRVAQIIFTFFVFLTLIFFLLNAQPGSSLIDQFTDPNMTAEMRQAIAKSFGLDKPLHEQYLIYLGNFLTGNLGVSFSNYPRPVIEIIFERAPRTLILFLSSTTLAFTIGFTMGKILAWRRGKVTEYVATIGGVTLYTIFLPWFGLMMIWFFAFILGWFPLGKFLDPVLWRGAPFNSDVIFGQMLTTASAVVVALFIVYFISRRLDPIRRQPTQIGGALVIGAAVLAVWIPHPAARYALDILHHLILPIATLATVSFAGSMLLTRNSMLETLREDFVMAARAKGLPDNVVRDKHAARNAMLPVVTAFVFGLALAIDGGVVTETIFSWPGMGQTLLQAVSRKDIPLAIGGLIFGGSLALTAHLIADILYAYLDPRIRYS
ncbi:MAG: ABC transporter permease [Chloroflexi bacterium]|nr:ABC transporter permease [Chloroflexota bacterium]